MRHFLAFVIASFFFYFYLFKAFFLSVLHTRENVEQNFVLMIYLNIGKGRSYLHLNSFF